MVIGYVKRVLDLRQLLAERSLFLLGPRQTGKSSYIREELNGLAALSWNLLDRGLLLRTLSDPGLLRREIEARELRDCVVFIDEIQKCPELLDEVQLLIEERGIRFLLTGSSARKLRTAGTNLLGGRARTRHFHPFTWFEVRGEGFSIERVMERGLLPPHWPSPSPDEDLAAYVDTYLTEEIAAEGLSRNLPAFARFLQTAAASNARMINYTNIANDAQLPRQTVKLWFQVLVDTLLGYELPAFRTAVKRKSIETAKFFFFDIGVVRTLRRIAPVLPGTGDFGEFFEHFIFMELRAWIDFRSPRTQLSYWRSKSGYEVDFLLNEEVAIEVKATARVSDSDLAGLKALREEGRLLRFMVVCRQERPELRDGIEIMPWEYFLQALWAGSLLKIG
ncbi:MAG: AAA family ATPase [Spirochaetota bacterium]